MNADMRQAPAKRSPAWVLSALGLLRHHPLLCYFLIAYGFSWLVWTPYVLSKAGVGLLPLHLPSIYVGLGAFTGPCLAGFIMTATVAGKTGIRELLKRFILWHVGIQWYLFVIVGIPAIALLGALALPGAISALTLPALLSALRAYPFVLLLAFVIDGGGEEPGWRGFALARMQAQYGPLGGTLLLGLLWAGWHLPLVLTAGYGGGPGGSLPVELETAVLFVPGVVFTAIVITWVFNNTRGSLLVAMLVHGAFDATPLPPGVGQILASRFNPLVPPMLGIGVLALLVVLLTRGRLSYGRYQREVIFRTTDPSVGQASLEG
jgi:membrane protease YdiL (CAAX protease family)